MSNRFLSSAVLFAFSLSLFSAESLRTWTSSDGRIIEARFVEMIGQNIKIENSSGVQFTLPLSRFSEKDLKYAEQASIQSDFLSLGPFKGYYEGAVVIASINGELKVFDPPKSDKYSDPKPIKARLGKIGEAVSVGTQLITGNGSRAILLLTNGTIFTMGEETKLVIKEFWQEEFESKEDRVIDIQGEVSPSRIRIGLLNGEMIVEVKKLQHKSSFLIETPLGVAGVRGTEFRLFSQSKFFKLGVLEGRVDFLNNEKKVKKVGVLRSLVKEMDSKVLEQKLLPQESKLIKEAIDRARSAAKDYSVAQLLESAEANNNRQVNSNLEDGGILEKQIEELLIEFKLPSKIKRIELGSDLFDIRLLEKLVNLEEINCPVNKRLSDFSVIEKLPKLKRFSIKYNRHARPHHFRNSMNLEDLKIYPSWARGDISDLSPLSNLKKLNSLNLANHSIKEASPLFEIKALESLDLSSNLLENCIGFDSMRNHLVHLNLSKNKIVDPSPLYRMKKLQTLDLSENPIDEKEKISLRRALLKCKISF